MLDSSLPDLGRDEGGGLEKRIFVSYSHADQQWLDRLLVAMAPLTRREELLIWTDHDLEPGDAWASRIYEALGRSNVAVLLVSANFLASSFVVDYELPEIFHGAEEQRLTVAWVPVSASAWDATELSKFQAVIDPSQPLDQMTDAQAQQALVTVARRIAGARTLTELSRTMHIVDEAYDGLAEEAGETPRDKEFRVTAHHTVTSLEFQERDEKAPIQVITAADLEMFPSEEHRLIQALQESMYNEYERWTQLYPKRLVLTSFERREYEAAGKRMCSDLGQILDFIEFQLGKNLYDHYNGVRWACRKLVEQGT